jgi:hypothetical protein
MKVRREKGENVEETGITRKDQVKIEVKSVKQHKKWGTINLIGCVRSTCT